ncbi:Signal transduction histidine kinase [Amycolatopsis arida]|uniref:histidine kinase n=1 Tax=Amycolatopsis arida TaxID=587909 RepID=A0A1I5U082_9PSEU|nr:sensor histidine kinase [Amycolatopsis arida]TDX95880.1 signal transduction histidine kinase [Amycolatopsis arida]SFP88684.1 Signal transduction histidine kinase [Amycolatopsis arida]
MFAARRHVTDLVGVVALAAFVLVGTTVAARGQPAARPLDLPGYGWLVAAALPLPFARRFPVPAFAASAAVALAYHWTPYPEGPVIALPGFALFLLGRVRGPVVGTIAAGVLLLALYLVDGVHRGDWVPDAFLAVAVAAAAAVLAIGAALRAREAAARAAREREAEHTRRLAEEERLRIAREVHDVVSHNLAMINVQAGMAAHVADRQPEQTKEALRNIKAASAVALSDLRSTLAVLRSGAGAAVLPGLAQMGELFDHAQSAGLDVRVHGRPGQLPRAVDGAAYRILQESLTNVVRHANSPSVVDVHFRRPGGRFELVVRDDGMGASPPRIGNGLRGMRERAEALGGGVEAGVTDEGGFQVRAVLPLDRATS